MFPYNRIVVWAAGPVSILAGWVATQLVQHVGLLGPLGLGQDKIAHAIVIAVTFGISALVTYAAHHKWLDNLSKIAADLPVPAPVLAVVADIPKAAPPEQAAADEQIVKPESAIKPDPPAEAAPAPAPVAPAGTPVAPPAA